MTPERIHHVFADGRSRPMTDWRAKTPLTRYQREIDAARCEILRRALAEAGGIVAVAASLLGTTRQTFYHYLGPRP